MSRSTLKWLVLLMALVVVSVVVYQYVYPKLRDWRLLHVARAERQGGNHYNSFIILLGLHYRNPESIAVLTELSQLSIYHKHPMTFHWLASWAALDTLNPYPLLQLGKLLIIQGDLKAAKTCLERLQSMGDVDEIGILELEAAILVSEKKFREAAVLFERYMNRHPQTDLNALWVKRAAIELKSTSTPVREAAVERLKELLDDADTNKQARSTLIAHYHTRGNIEEAVRLCEEHLQRYPDAHEHTLLWIDLSVKTQKDLDPLVPNLLLEQIASQPGRLPEVIAFLMHVGIPALAEDLLEGLPDKLADTPTAFYSYAILFERQGRWKELNANLGEQDWGELAFLRSAYLLQAREKLDYVYGNSAILNVLVKELSQSPVKALKIDEMARRWGWVENRLAIWNGLSPTILLPRPFLKKRVLEAHQHRDTVALYGYTLLLIRYYPDHPEILNNHISYALLLNQDTAFQLERAEANVERLDDRAVALTTYAFALLKNEKPSAALEVVAGMLPADRSRPAISFYQELIRRANGKPAIDQTDFINDSSLQLLPEEIALWRQYDSLSILTPDRGIKVRSESVTGL
ncbi:MAG: hypothetical protein AAF571_02650 [Verrucomicrobiota bacterium]